MHVAEASRARAAERARREHILRHVHSESAPATWRRSLARGYDSPGECCDNLGYSVDRGFGSMHAPSTNMNSLGRSAGGSCDN